LSLKRKGDESEKPVDEWANVETEVAKTPD